MTAGIRTFITTCAAVLLTGATAAQAGAAENPPLLPLPASLVAQTSSFALAGARIDARTEGARAAAARLSELLARSGHPRFGLSNSGTIHFLHDASVAGTEAYRLTVSPEGITIAASSDAGFYYGAETLWQLILSATDGHLDAIHIEDAPAFGWRGVMLDSVRHFQPASYVRELIDRMAMLKLNRLHWHLTDDQGWRLPVPEYPRLISTGAWRQEAGAEGIDPKTGKALRYGGFYTEAEIREIVAYAAARHIEIVPEVDMPGHMTAAIAAYPWLASTPNPPSKVSNLWGILPNLINPSDHGLEFAKTVLDQVMRLFPGAVIHIGGDEAVKDQWNANPVIQAQIKALGLEDANALQAWFMGQLSAYLEAHGRRTIGWDEILDGPVPGDAIVMSWRGSEGALAAAKLGHDTVLAPAPVFYLDNRQSLSDDEPPGRGEVVSWRRLYEAETAPEALSDEQKRHILGVQVNLWTEHIRTTDYADRMLWPRAAVLAEMGWSKSTRRWDEFAPRLLTQMAREQGLGFKANLVPLQPMAEFARSASGGTAATLSQPAGIGTLRYTLDGSTPKADSPIYATPLDLASGTVLTAQAFAGTAPLATPKSWTIVPALTLSRSGNELAQCTAKLPLRMEDDAPTGGVRKIHFADIMNPCWSWKAAPLDGITRIAADILPRPYNFALADALASVTIDQAEPGRELLKIRMDNCEGPILVSLSLAPATGRPGISRIEGTLDRPVEGSHDLCITFAQNGLDPIWLLDRLTLKP